MRQFNRVDSRDQRHQCYIEHVFVLSRYYFPCDDLLNMFYILYFKQIYFFMNVTISHDF